jgi:hypothetical protein
VRLIPYGCNLGFLDRSRYNFFQVAPQFYSRGWVDPVPHPLLLRKFINAGYRRTQTIRTQRRSCAYVPLAEIIGCFDRWWPCIYDAHKSCNNLQKNLNFQSFSMIPHALPRNNVYVWEQRSYRALVLGCGIVQIRADGFQETRQKCHVES